jgi:hypothetical protein
MKYSSSSPTEFSLILPRFTGVRKLLLKVQADGSAIHSVYFPCRHGYVEGMKFGNSFRSESISCPSLSRKPCPRTYVTGMFTQTTHKHPTRHYERVNASKVGDIADDVHSSKHQIWMSHVSHPYVVALVAAVLSRGSALLSAQFIASGTLQSAQEQLQADRGRKNREHIVSYD